jgi:hypothetical protein
MATISRAPSALTADLQAQLDRLKADKVYKRLNHLESPQGARVRMEGRGEVVILSSNNYLGLANEPAVVDAGIDALRRYGAGTASVRFICGTFTVHRELEEALARFVGTEASLSFVSAWNANEALTASVVEEGDFVISDALNHASIIDSIRLAKAIKKCTTGGVPARRPGRPAREARGQPRRPPEADLDRRRVLDGGLDRQAPRHPRDRARARCGRGDGRLARHRACSARRDAARRSTSACSARSTSSPRRSARRSAARRAGSSRRARRSST